HADLLSLVVTEDHIGRGVADQEALHSGLGEGGGGGVVICGEHRPFLAAGLACLEVGDTNLLGGNHVPTRGILSSHESDCARSTLGVSGLVPKMGTMSSQQEFVLRTLEERDIRFVRLWFTDSQGFMQSVTVG